MSAALDARLEMRQGLGAVLFPVCGVLARSLKPACSVPETSSSPARSGTAHWTSYPIFVYQLEVAMSHASQSLPGAAASAASAAPDSSPAAHPGLKTLKT